LPPIETIVLQLQVSMKKVYNKRSHGCPGLFVQRGSSGYGNLVRCFLW
jgi:hypothetical protein